MKRAGGRLKTRLLIAVGLTALSCLNAHGQSQTEEQAAVKGQVSVHSRASFESPVAGELRQGDVVTLEMELESPEGHWCAVRHAARSIAGYVPCESLERPQEKKKFWERTTPPAPPEPRNEKEDTKSPEVKRP